MTYSNNIIINKTSGTKAVKHTFNLYNSQHMHNVSRWLLAIVIVTLGLHKPNILQQE
jgi:hypothetical protein